MKLLRKTKECTLSNQIRNEDIRTDLNIFSTNNRILQNAMKWKEHIERMKQGGETGSTI